MYLIISALLLAYCPPGDNGCEAQEIQESQWERMQERRRGKYERWDEQQRRRNEYDPNEPPPPVDLT